MLLESKRPCPCGKSSDAWHVYDNGGFCFSCKNENLPKDFRKESTLDSSSTSLDQSPAEDSEAVYDFREWRGVRAETWRHYSVLTKIQSGKPVSVFFPYERNRGKVRSVLRKEFHWIGDSCDKLFGQDAFPPASSDTITITEGEVDAPSIFQTVGRPAVSIHSSGTAVRDIRKQRDYVTSFKKVILAFDGDSPGKSAAQAVASSGLIDFDRLYWIQFPPGTKDANSYIEAGRAEDLKRLWWNATKFMPLGVSSRLSEFDSVIDDAQFQDPLGTFPFEALQEMVYGLRPGEVTLFTAPSGIGKTEVVRALEYHILKTTDHNIGVIHLEESKNRSIRGLAGLHLQAPAHIPGRLSNEEVKTALHDLVKRDDRLHVYQHFGTDDPNVILDTFRFLVAACGVRVVVLDHISALATGLEEKDERKILDYICTKLERMVVDLNFHLVMISHINDDGKTWGSRTIHKVCNTRIDLSRDIISEDEVTRNTTSLIVSKNRFGSVTGPAGRLLFDKETFTLSELPWATGGPLKGSEVIDAKDLPV